jgi:hypothetical protein
MDITSQIVWRTLDRIIMNSRLTGVDKCRQLEMLTAWLKSESRIRLTELNIDRAQTRSAMNLGGVQ